MDEPRYDVVVVEDEQMPWDDWMLIEHEQGMTFVIRRSADLLSIAAEGWAAFRLLVETPALRVAEPAAV